MITAIESMLTNRAFEIETRIKFVIRKPPSFIPEKWWYWIASRFIRYELRDEIINNHD